MKDNQLKEIIGTLLQREKSELLERLRYYRTLYAPYGKRQNEIVNKIIATWDARDEKTKKYHDRLGGLIYHRWCFCFSVQMQEILFTILEKAGPKAFKEYLKQKEYNYTNGEATVKEAYDFLIGLHPARIRLFLSLIDNGSIAYVYLQKKDFDGFFNSLNHTKTGLNELLSFCKKYIDDQDLILSAVRINSGNYDDDNTYITRAITYFLNTPNITSVFDSIRSNIFSDVTNDQTIRRKAVLISYYRTLKDFCRVNHKYYFKTTHDVAVDLICEKQWSRPATIIFFYLIERLGFSIEEDVLSRSNSEHDIITQAKFYIKNRDAILRTIGLNKPKGRKVSSWLKIDSIYSEAEIGQLFKNEVWRALKNRILKFKLIDPETKKEIIGNRANKIIETLGCCFIFYSAYTLGYANKFEESQSSFTRTINVLLESPVSRNTIKKYMWVLNEAENWTEKQPSYKTSSRKNNVALALILEKNLDEIINTIDFVKVELEKIFRKYIS